MNNAASIINIMSTDMIKNVGHRDVPLIAGQSGGYFSTVVNVESVLGIMDLSLKDLEHLKFGTDTQTHLNRYDYRFFDISTT